MVLNYLVSLLIVAAIYAFTFPDSQLASTASAIRQIWSGSCRLSCRQSEYSGFSGLSGLAPDHDQNKACCAGHSGHAGPSSGCICETCPCALLENVLRTCQPATSIYSRFIDFIASFCYIVMEMVSTTYNYLERVINCRATCQRLPQLDEAQGSTSDGVNRDKILKDGVEKRNDKNVNCDSGIKSTKSIVFRDRSDTRKSDKLKHDEPSRNNSDIALSGVSDVTLRPKEKDSRTSADVNSCPKCKEQGKVCMKKCPKAYLKSK